MSEAVISTFLQSTITLYAFFFAVYALRNNGNQDRSFFNKLFKGVTLIVATTVFSYAYMLLPIQHKNAELLMIMSTHSGSNNIPYSLFIFSTSMIMFYSIMMFNSNDKQSNIPRESTFKGTINTILDTLGFTGLILYTTMGIFLFIQTSYMKITSVIIIGIIILAVLILGSHFAFMIIDRKHNKKNMDQD